MRSMFSASSLHSPLPYPSPSHPFASRAPTTRRPACEDVMFFDVPVSEIGKLAAGDAAAAWAPQAESGGGEDATWTTAPQAREHSCCRAGSRAVATTSGCGSCIARAERTQTGSGERLGVLRAGSQIACSQACPPELMRTP